MKKTTLLLFCLVCSAIAFGQRNVHSEWRKEVNTVFSGLDLSRVPTKVLLDYAFEYTNVPAYNGTITDSTAINVDVFSDIYSTLYMGRIVADSVHFPKLEKIAQSWVEDRIKAASGYNTITLAGLYYKYSRIDIKALQENKITVVDNASYADKFIGGIWQDPYETLNTVAFTPPVNSFNKKTFNVVLPRHLMFGNSIADIKKIELDGQDGNGYSELEFGKPVTLDYEKEGSYKWTYRITLADQTILYSYSYFNIKDASPADNTINLISGASLHIDYAPGHSGELRKPFIVVEGFDTGHITKPEVDGGDRTLSHFYASIQFSGELDNILADDPTQEYDVIYVDWHNGTADLRENSEVLEDIINWVNDQKQGDEDIIILGQSMGGVITRYTLARMEQDSDPRDHNVGVYISHDAPHQGSNTLLSGQMFVRHMYNDYLDSPISALGEDVLPVIFTLADLMVNFLNDYAATNLSIDAYVSPGDIFTLQDTPAAVQMNYYWFTPLENVDVSMHQAWQQELETMGYPQDSYNIAISNGNECGDGQDFAPGIVMAQMHKEGNKAFFRRFLWGLATPLIGIAIDDIELALLGILPGSSRYYFDFELKALPDLGTASNIYNGKIRYKKKFLWIGPSIWHTITERNKTAPSYAFPFDSYPGGKVDISSYGDEIPDIFPDFDIKQPTYNFIPTLSALDVRRNDMNPDPGDYLRVYAFNSMPATALTTPFDNFLVDNRLNAPYNGNHITFQLRTGNWLANEIDAVPGNDEVFDCRIQCVNEISGPERICDFGGSFSVPEGADSYLWNVIGGDIVTITSPTDENTLTIERNGAKSGWIEVGVRISSENCDVDDRVIKKEVYIGAPTVQSIDYINTSSGGGGSGPGSGDDPEMPDNGPVLPMNPTLISDGCEVYLEMNYTPGINEITDIEWQKVSTDISWSRDIVDHSGRYVYLYPNCNKPFTFKIRTKSDCGGWSHWQEFTHNITACTSSCSSGNPNGLTSENFYLSPVPSDTELNIGIVTNHVWNFPPPATIINPGGNPYVDPDSGNSGSSGSSGPYTHSSLLLNLSFYNSIGNLALSATTTGIPAEVNVSALPPGNYVLVIEYQGQTESHNILIN